MAFTASEKARILYGHLSLSAYARTGAASHTRAMLDTTVLEVANNAQTFIPGMHTSTFTADGPLDVDATSNGQADALADFLASTAPVPITYGQAGYAVGDRVWLIDTIETALATTTTLTGTVDWSCSAQTTANTDLYGVMLETPTAVTQDGNGTARNNGAATSNGGVAHLHVTAFSGLTNNIVTIEHSVDGSTSWATLVTFATYTGVTSERVVVAAGTTVRQYLRVVDNVTGSGSTTRAVAFCRR